MGTNKQTLAVIDFPSGPTGSSYVSWNFPMPSSLIGGGYYTTEIFWTQTEGATGSICWGVEGTTATNDTSLDIAWPAYGGSVIAYGTTANYIRMTPIYSGLNFTTRDDYTTVRVCVDHSATTMTSTAHLIAVVLHNFAP